MDNTPVTLMESIETLLGETQAEIQVSKQPALQMYSSSGFDASYAACHILILGRKGRIMLTHVVHSELSGKQTIGIHTHGYDGSSEIVLMDNPFRREPLHGYLLEQVTGMLERIL